MAYKEVFGSRLAWIVHPQTGDPSPSEADMRLTRRILEASTILQLHSVDHVIIGMPALSRNSYFSFKEAGVIG